MGMLELYRSGDFEKLRPYDGQVAAMDAPTLILWGENDPTVPVAAARRFEQEIPEDRGGHPRGGESFPLRRRARALRA